MKKIFSASVALTFLLPVLVFAGEYVLVEGKDMEVCRAYGENLNSFKNLPHAMVCERKLNPKFKDFKKPEWKELNAWKNIELIMKMDYYLFYSRTEEGKVDYEKNKEKYLEKLKEEIKKNKIKISLARVDIDNNGKLDNVIKYDLDVGFCSDTDESNFARPTGQRLIIFNDDMTAVNEDLSFFTNSSQYGIFIYKGRTYLDYWGGELKFKSSEVHVLDSVMNTTGWTGLGARICTYKTKSKSKSKKGGASVVRLTLLYIWLF